MYFRIKVGSDVIYQGKIVSSTGSSTALSVRINDICADWLAHARQSLSRTALANLTHPCTFAVEKSSNGSSWSTAESVQFWEDWSYDAKFLETSSGLAFPINGHIDKRQPIIWCSDTESGLIPASIRFTGSASVASIYLSTETTGTAAITCPSTTNDTDYLRAIRYGGPYVTSFRLGDKYSTRTDYRRNS